MKESLTMKDSSEMNVMYAELLPLTIGRIRPDPNSVAVANNSGRVFFVEKEKAGLYPRRLEEYVQVYRCAGLHNGEFVYTWFVDQVTKDSEPPPPLIFEFSKNREPLAYLF
jgi:hypothetical protein